MGLSKLQPSMMKLEFRMPFKSLHEYQDMAVSVFCLPLLGGGSETPFLP